MDQSQLADFLRTRREALTPSQVGRSAGPRRRTAGLRREEVASLALISTDYYTRMEQRRAPQPSTEVVASLARALRLSVDERDHLYRLAGHNAPARSPDADHVSRATMRILDRLADTPAQVMSALGETLVQTPAARALLGDETSFDGLARNVVYRWFTDPRARDVYPADDHAAHGRSFVAAARVAYARDGAGSRSSASISTIRYTSTRCWCSPPNPERRVTGSSPPSARIRSPTRAAERRRGDPRSVDNTALNRRSMSGHRRGVGVVASAVRPTVEENTCPARTWCRFRI